MYTCTAYHSGTHIHKEPLYQLAGSSSILAEDSMYWQEKMKHSGTVPW